MKTLYKSILFISFAGVALTTNAQDAAKDTTLNRQVILQRDYNPSIKEASRINVTPSVFAPKITPRAVNFYTGVPQVSITNTFVGDSKSGDVGTNIEYDKKRGYARLGLGTHMNTEAVAGYQIVNTAADRLNVFGSYNSTNGDVDYLEKGFGRKEEKAKYSEFNLNLAYEHKFTPAILSFDASFMNMGYNYYGNPFLVAPLPIDMPLMSKKQSTNVFGIGAGFRSNEDNNPYMRYNGTLRYRGFTNKYGPNEDLDGMKGGQIDLNVDVNTPFHGDKLIGVKGAVMNQSINSLDYSAISPEADHSLTHVQLTPYLGLEGESWYASIGIKVGGAFDVKNTFTVAPDIHASLKILEKNALYASITGGINENTFLQTLTENRYVNPLNRVGYSNTLYDLKAGFKVGTINGFEFAAFAGYKYTKNDHLYLTNQYTSFYSWGNLSNAVYANVSTGHFGAEVRTHLIPYTNLSARLTAYTYGVKYSNGYLSSLEADPTEKKAWGRPNFTAELNADVTDVFPNLTLSVNYLLSTGRKAYFHGDVKSMKAINELNFRGEYKLFDWLSVNLKLNNVLFQKYEHVYGYAQQGFNVLGGVSLQF